MTIRYPLAAILLATIVAGLLTTSTALSKAPGPTPATGESSPEEVRRAVQRFRDFQAARADS